MPNGSERAFELHHVVAFEETNVVGNVYYANHIRWQGRCRELFLHEHAPEILDEIERGLALVTVRVSCDYFAELSAFDEITIRMTLKDLSRNRMTLRFEVQRRDGAERQIVARGEQQLACMRRRGHEIVPESWPPTLRDAVQAYAAS